MRITITLLLISLATLALIHNIALHFYLYWSHAWIDIPIHFFGGVCVAFGIASLTFFGIRLPRFFSSFLGYVVLSLFVGTVWELFEYVGGISTYDADFVLDTSIDFCMDVLGTVVGYFIVSKLGELEQ